MNARAAAPPLRTISRCARAGGHGGRACRRCGAISRRGRRRRSFYLGLDRVLARARPRLAPLVLSARRGETVVALALLQPARLRRHVVVTSDALMLHQTGDPARDGITIEYNGILADRGCRRWRRSPRASRSCIGPARRARWDEIFCANVTAAFAAAGGAQRPAGPHEARAPAHLARRSRRRPARRQPLSRDAERQHARADPPRHAAL